MYSAGHEIADLRVAKAINSSENNSTLLPENRERTNQLLDNIEDIDEPSDANDSSEKSPILPSENGESTIQQEQNAKNIHGAFNANFISEDNFHSENGESTVQVDHSTQDIREVTYANASSENNLILRLKNGESMVQLGQSIKDIDGATNTNVRSENNSLFLTENKGSTVKLSMKSYCYTWTINDFFKCLNFCLLEQSADSHFNLNSPSFIIENTEWGLNLRVITVSEQSNSKVEEMRVILESKSSTVKDFYLKNEVCVVDDDGKIILSFYPKKIVGIGNRKEYSYSFLPLRGTKTFVLPYKLIVRNEFSILISETCEDTESSFSKSDKNKAAESECFTKNDSESVSPPPEWCTRLSTLPRILPTFWPSLERVGVGMREYLIPIIVVLCVSLVLVSLANKNYDEIPTIKSNKNLIFDYVTKLNHIAEVLNLTDVKKKSLEILVLYSKMYNSTNHVNQSTDRTDQIMESTNSSTSHVMQSTDCTDHVIHSVDSSDHIMQSTDSTDDVMQSTDSTDDVMQSTDSTDDVMQSTDSTDDVMQSADTSALRYRIGAKFKISFAWLKKYSNAFINFSF